MSKCKRCEELEEAVWLMLEAFDVVFHWDWEYARSCIVNPGYYGPDLAAPVDSALADVINPAVPTFVLPDVLDESNNWGNRGGLLAAYRNLRALMPEYDEEGPPLPPDR